MNFHVKDINRRREILPTSIIEGESSQDGSQGSTPFPVQEKDAKKPRTRIDSVGSQDIHRRRTRASLEESIPMETLVPEVDDEAHVAQPRNFVHRLKNLLRPNKSHTPSSDEPPVPTGRFSRYRQKAVAFFLEYGRFVGPGFMISVAYMDPGNYSTDISAGAQFRFALLFVVFLSNCIAVFLQSLAIKLGTVTGRDLAQISREEFPMWLNVLLYVLAEIAIICTDIAEVIGTAIALNILLRIPLIAGVFLTIIDVLLILMAYKPGNSMNMVYVFEYGVAALVMGVVICFAVMLARIPPVSAADVFRGFLPSHHLIEGNALYSACGILGATVMPHSLYLGSAIVKPRLMDFDLRNNNLDKDTQTDVEDGFYENYRPSVAAIKYAMKFSVIELSFSLFTFALFVNSAILIVAGAVMYGRADAADADLYTIHDILSELLSATAGTIFMLALLFSGQSAGIICTIAGQIVSEGYLHWTIRPWLRRIVTRTIAIIPCVIVTGAVGRKGLSATLNASQVALSILLPFLVAPLVYLTCKTSLMTIRASEGGVPEDGNILVSNTTEPNNNNNNGEESTSESSQEADTADASPVVGADIDERLKYRAGPPLSKDASFRNNWLTMISGVVVWLFICILNVYLIVCLGMGKS